MLQIVTVLKSVGEHQALAKLLCPTNAPKKQRWYVLGLPVLNISTKSYRGILHICTSGTIEENLVDVGKPLKKSSIGGNQYLDYL